MLKTKLRLAVVGVVVSGSKVLLVQKKHSPEKELGGKWMFPGGDVWFGEEPRDALRSIASHDLHLDIEVGEIVGLGSQRRQRGECVEFIATIWLQAMPARSAKLNPTKQWQAAIWVERRNVFARLSDSARRWLPPEVLNFLLV